MNERGSGGNCTKDTRWITIWRRLAPTLPPIDSPAAQLWLVRTRYSCHSSPHDLHQSLVQQHNNAVWYLGFVHAVSRSTKFIHRTGLELWHRYFFQEICRRWTVFGEHCDCDVSWYIVRPHVYSINYCSFISGSLQMPCIIKYSNVTYLVVLLHIYHNAYTIARYE